MNHFLTSAFAAFLFTGLAGIYFVSKKEATERFFGFFWLNVAFWTLFVAFQFQIQRWMSGFFWGLILHLGCVFVPVLFLHFVLYFTESRSKYAFVLKLTYLFAIAFLLLDAFTSVFTGQVIYRNYYTYPKPAILYPVYILYFQVVGFWTLVLCLKLRKTVSSQARQWMDLFLVLHILAYIGCMDNYLIMYDIRFFPLYPYGLYLLLPYAILGSYAIVKFQAIRRNSITT